MIMSQYEKTVSVYQSKNIQTISQFENILDNFKILFAYNSGKIENEEITYHDTREVFEKGKVLNFTGDPKIIFEIENQKKAYDYLKLKIIDKVPLSIDLIKETHRVLTEGTYDYRRFVEQGERPGEFKKHDYVTGIHEVGSSVETVEDDLKEILEVMQDFKATEPLKAATYFHLQFEAIHPFADGNGRVGRTLMNYFLMTHNHPPIIIYDEDKKYYYAALQSFDEEENYLSMYEFLKYQTEKTWEKSFQLQKVQEKDPLLSWISQFELSKGRPLTEIERELATDLFHSQKDMKQNSQKHSSAAKDDFDLEL